MKSEWFAIWNESNFSTLKSNMFDFCTSQCVCVCVLCRVLLYFSLFSACIECKMPFCKPKISISFYPYSYFDCDVIHQSRMNMCIIFSNKFPSKHITHQHQHQHHYHSYLISYWIFYLFYNCFLTFCIVSLFLFFFHIYRETTDLLEVWKKNRDHINCWHCKNLSAHKRVSSSSNSNST